MIGNIYTDAARANWATVPGRKAQAVNNANGDPLTVTFTENGVVVFVQYFTYDANGNFLSVECKTE